jgi:site-specific recombinase XerD
MKKLTSFDVLFVPRAKRNGKKHLERLYARITVDSKRTEMSLSREVTTGLFDPGAQRCKGNSKEARALNDFLSLVRGEIYEIRKQLMLEGKSVSAERIKAFYKGEPDPDAPKNPTVLELYDEHNRKFVELIGTKNHSKPTYKKHLTSRSHVSNFIKEAYEMDDLEWKEINVKFLNEYEYWLKTQRECNHNSSMKYIVNFGKAIRIAYSEGYMDRNPLDQFKITLEKTHRDVLSEEEIEWIQDLDLHGRLDKVRDCFVFSIYSGLPFIDLEELTMDDIEKDKNGKLWIVKSRHKTDIDFIIPVLPETKALIEKYDDHPLRQKKGIVLPVLSNQKYNAYLKEIADLAGINKYLTTHLARHTFATTVTLNNGIPLEIVSKMLGHSSVKTTQIYAKVQQKAIEMSMGELMNKKPKKRKKKNNKKNGKGGQK